jgi:HD-like signal output (HDOD) protein
VSELADDQLPFASGALFTCPDCRAQIKLDLGLRQEQDSSTPPAETRQQEEDAKTTAPSSGKEPLSGQALKNRILRTVGDLPPMPQVVHKARQVMANPISTFKDLAIVIIADQAIATKVLKLANSAYYGLSGRVSSIQHASVVLGQKTLAELLTLACTSKLMGKTLKGYGLKSGELWQHSLAVAFGSRLIANKKNPVLADDAFSAGLIHDAGKLVLDKYIFERRQDIEQFMADGRESFLAAEKEILGFDHAEIASEVCKAWKVPDHLNAAIRYHHYPSRSKDNPLGYIIHVADTIAMMSELSTGTDDLSYDLSYEMDDSATEFLDLQNEDMNKFMGQMVASVQKTMQELGNE